MPVPGRERAHRSRPSAPPWRRAPARSARTRLWPCRIPAARGARGWPNAASREASLGSSSASLRSIPSRMRCSSIERAIAPPPATFNRLRCAAGGAYLLTIPHTLILYPAFAARQVGVCPLLRDRPGPRPPPGGPLSAAALLSFLCAACWPRGLRAAPHKDRRRPADAPPLLAVIRRAPSCWLAGQAGDGTGLAVWPQPAAATRSLIMTALATGWPARPGAAVAAC